MTDKELKAKILAEIERLKETYYKEKQKENETINTNK